MKINKYQYKIISQHTINLKYSKTDADILLKKRLQSLTNDSVLTDNGLIGFYSKTKQLYIIKYRYRKMTNNSTNTFENYYILSQISDNKAEYCFVNDVFNSLFTKILGIFCLSVCALMLIFLCFFFNSEKAAVEIIAAIVSALCGIMFIKQKKESISDVEKLCSLYEDELKNL